jgi:sec-independent protein translocase protein TatA
MVVGLNECSLSVEVDYLIGSKIGLWEILLILAVALIIFGPAKLPELGRSIGNGLKEFRKATRELKDTISLENNDIDLDDKKN